MLQASTVCDVLNLLIGILSPSSASPAILMNPGTPTLTCANAAHLPDQSKQENAYAQPPKLSGIPTPKLAAVLPTLTVISANHVQPQDSGISLKKNAFARHPKLNGIKEINNANVQLELMETTALNAPLQGSGIPNKMHVSVLLQELYGTLQTNPVNVHKDCSAFNVLPALTQDNGRTLQISAFAQLP